MFNPDHLEKEADEYRKKIAKFDSANAALVKSNFDSRVGFAEAVDAKIKPCIQKLAIADRKGTTFYFGSNWISSNSHVVASLKELAIASLAGKGLAGVVSSGFFRPKALGNYPDIMVANISGIADNKSIPIRFTEDVCHAESLTFYIDIYDRENPVKLLNKIEDAKSGLLAYKQADGNKPEPGTSGSPIVEARLVITKKDSPPQWVFALQGVLFAYQKETLNVYAVELGKDLEQIRMKMLFKKQEQERAQESGEAAITLGDNPACFWSDAAKAEASHDKELVCYNEGVGASIIDLPDNLVPLDGSTIISLKCSYHLVSKEREPIKKGYSPPGTKGTKRKHKTFVKSSGLKFEQLCDDRDKLYSRIQKMGVIKLPDCNDSSQSSDVDTTDYLRVDHIGSIDSGYFIFALQDNLEDKNNESIKINGKSASSNFAMAKIYTNSLKIDCSLLIAMLRESEEIVKKADEEIKRDPSYKIKSVKYWAIDSDPSSDYNEDNNIEFKYDGARSVAAVALYTDRKENKDLYSAVIRGDLSAIESLKDKANFMIVDKEGNNLLHLAIKNCPPTVVLPVVCSLLGCGVDINAKNKSGICPLILALKKGYADVATALIDFGVNVNVVDRNEKTAIELARAGAEKNKGFDVVVTRIEENSENSENSSLQI